MKTYHARVERGEVKYWAVWVEEIQRATQARHLRELDVMTRDLIEIMDPDAGEFTVEYEYVLPDEAAQHIQRRELLRAQMERLQAAAASENAAAAAALTDLGIPARDAGQLLGVSHQRVSQLVKQATDQKAAAAVFSALDAQSAIEAVASAMKETRGGIGVLRDFAVESIATKDSYDGSGVFKDRDGAPAAAASRALG